MNTFKNIDFFKESYLKILKETEEHIQKFIDKNKPKELSNEEFLSLFEISYRFENYYMGNNDTPRLFLDIRLKTPKEMSAETNNG